MTQYTFTWPPMWLLNSALTSHPLCGDHPYHKQPSLGSWEWHHIDDILLWGDSFDILKIQISIHTAAGKRGGTTAQHTAQTCLSVKFLGVIWFIKYCSIHNIVMKQWLTLAEPTILTQAQYLLGLLVFYRQHVRHLQILFKCIHTVTFKLVHFKWGLQWQRDQDLSKMQ